MRLSDFPRRFLDHFVQASRLDVVDEASHRNVPWNPGMRLCLLRLYSHVLLQIIEGVEMCRHDWI